MYISYQQLVAEVDCMMIFNQTIFTATSVNTVSFHFSSAVVSCVLPALDCIIIILLTKRDSKPSFSCVNRHESSMWFMSHCWPHWQRSDMARLHLCRFVRHQPWPVWKRLSSDHDWRGRSNPGCQMVESCYKYITDNKCWVSFRSPLRRYINRCKVITKPEGKCPLWRC